jgi:hypothetical protein
MLFPTCGGIDDSRSVFITVKNVTEEPLRPGKSILIPRDAELKDDDRYIASCRAAVGHKYILPNQYGTAKLTSAVFWAD